MPQSSQVSDRKQLAFVGIRAHLFQVFGYEQDDRIGWHNSDRCAIPQRPVAAAREAVGEVLNGPVGVPMAAGGKALHEIKDVEGFCHAIVSRHTTDDLSLDDREELIVYLVGVAWELSLRFDGSQGSRFVAYAKRHLGLRIVDWRRSRFGRSRWQFAGQTYERERPIIVSLNTDEGNRLVETLATGVSDSETDWDETGGGLLAGRDRTRAQDLAQLGRYADY